MPGDACASTDDEQVFVYLHSCMPVQNGPSRNDKTNERAANVPTFSAPKGEGVIGGLGELEWFILPPQPGVLWPEPRATSL